MARTFYQSATVFSGSLTLLQDAPPGAGVIDTGRLNGGADTGLSFGFVTPVDVPGASGSNAGTFTVSIRITTGNSNLTVRPRLARRNGSTIFGTGIPPNEAAQVCNVGTYTFTWTSPNLGSWAAGDQLVVAPFFANGTNAMNQSCQFGVGASSDVVETPWTGPVQSVSGSGAASFEFLGAGNGAPVTVVQGTGSGYYAFSATGSGQAAGAQVPGQGSALFGFSGSSTGKTKTLGSGATSFGFVAQGSGVPRGAGSGLALWTHTATSGGRVRSFGQGQTAWSFTAQAGGSSGAFGSGAVLFSFAAGGSGLPRSFGQGAESIDFMATGSGGIPFTAQETGTLGDGADVFLVDPDTNVTVIDIAMVTATVEPCDGRVAISVESGGLVDIFDPPHRPTTMETQ